MTELHEHTAVELGRMLRDGAVSSREVTEHYLRRIDDNNAEVGAFVTVAADLALAQADAADDFLRTHDKPAIVQRSLLVGVPCPIKDLDDLAGVPTAFGSAAFRTVPGQDTSVVARIRRAGLITTGKTNTPEFGLPCYTEPDNAPPARNPANLDYSAGGSSGGAAAAVAAQLSPLAQGSDGGGSIRIPASMTGCVGIKPSRGRVSNGPLPELVGELPTRGPLGATVADAAALLDVMTGNEVGDLFTLPSPAPGEYYLAATTAIHEQLSPQRIGLYREGSLADVRPVEQVDAALTRAADALTALGHQVDVIERPIGPEYLDAFQVLWEALAASAPLTVDQEQSTRPLTRYLRGLGRDRSAAELANALARLRLAAVAALKATAPYDAILAPTLAELPPKVGAIRNDSDPAADFARQTQLSPYCAIYNITGQPAINVCVARTDHNLPIGVQLVGRIGGEATIIALAAQLEYALPWRSTP